MSRKKLHEEEVQRPLFGTAAILAGGKSSRMGEDKQLLCIDGKRLIELQLDSLKKIFQQVIILTNRTAAYDFVSKYESACFQVQVVEDDYKQTGPLGGLHKALKMSQSQYVYMIACDMPYMDLGFITYMEALLEAQQKELCAVGEREPFNVQPLNAFYHKDLVPKIESHLENGNLSLKFLIQKANALLVTSENLKNFDATKMFCNVNTKEDLEKLIDGKWDFEKV